MSYKSSYGYLVADGKDVTANLEYSTGSATAAPANVSVLRRDFIDKQFEKIATSELKAPADITEAELLSSLGITDKRL
jgi:hypothetical protein